MTENQVSESDALNAPNKRKYIDRYFRECRRIGGVQNVIVFNSMGIPKQSTFERDETIRAIGLFDDLITKTSRAIQTVHRLDTFASMRLRTRKFEILITKDLDDLYFVVFQNIDDAHRRIEPSDLKKTEKDCDENEKATNAKNVSLDV